LRWWLVLTLCPVCLATLGCAEVPLADLGASWRLPWSEKPDHVPGIVAPAERIARLRQLAEDAPKTAVADQQRVSAELAEVLRTEVDPMIRSEIVRTLGAFSTPASTPLLQAALADSDSVVRMAACSALGKRGGPEAVSALGEVISNDTSPDVRLAATRALGQTGDREAVGGLRVALEDADPALQRRAVLSLQQITGEDLGHDVNQWRQYVRGELPRPTKPPSLVQRIRRLF